MLVERIGTAAMLEQTAEECAELSQACLKASRLLRGENPVYKDKREIIANLHEEIADLYICLDELQHSEIIREKKVNAWVIRKLARMVERMGAE